ncbi:MAG: MBL fold metallo-hydrolase, partial [Candidatus Hodarchaeales archaeon]
MKELIRGITWFLGQGLDCNAFIIESEGQSILIDSGLGGGMTQTFGVQKNSVGDLEQIIKQKKINRVFLTHGHIDHVGGTMALQSKL